MKLIFLRKPHAEPKKGTRSYRAIALTSVFSKRYAFCTALSLRARDGTIKMEATACGRIDWNKLSTDASDGNKSATKTLGMPGGQNPHVEAWECSAPHQHGHKDSFRWGEAEARGENFGKPMIHTVG